MILYISAEDGEYLNNHRIELIEWILELVNPDDVRISHWQTAADGLGALLKKMHIPFRTIRPVRPSSSHTLEDAIILAQKQICAYSDFLLVIAKEDSKGLTPISKHYLDNFKAKTIIWMPQSDMVLFSKPKHVHMEMKKESRDFIPDKFRG